MPNLPDLEVSLTVQTRDRTSCLSWRWVGTYAEADQATAWLAALLDRHECYPTSAERALEAESLPREEDIALPFGE